MVRWGGHFDNLSMATKRLALAVPVALALIFLLLYVAFGEILFVLPIIYAYVYRREKQPAGSIRSRIPTMRRSTPFSLKRAVLLVRQDAGHLR